MNYQKTLFTTATLFTLLSAASVYPNNIEKLWKSVNLGYADTAKNLLPKVSKTQLNELVDGDPLLTTAIKTVDQIDFIEALINRGADVDLATRAGITPIVYAVAQKKLPVVKLLIAKGADVNKGMLVNMTALEVAIENGIPSIIKALLKAGANVNKQNKMGITPLVFAVKKGNLEIVNDILTYGININKQTILDAKKFAETLNHGKIIGRLNKALENMGV